MLSNYPKEKDKFKELLVRYMKNQMAQRSPFISEIPRVRVFEGKKQYLVREDGSTEESTFQEIRSDINFNIKELEDINIDSLLNKLELSAEEISKGQAKLVYDNINRVVEEVGNVVNAKGRSFSPDIILEMLEKIQVEFDDHGNPFMPSIVVNPKTANEINLEQVLLNSDTDPRFNELMDKKREEWRDREASRRLVG